MQNFTLISLALFICFSGKAGIATYMKPSGVQGVHVYRGCYEIVDYKVYDQGREWVGIRIADIDKTLFIEYDWQQMRTYKKGDLSNANRIFITNYSIPSRGYLNVKYKTVSALDPRTYGF